MIVVDVEASGIDPQKNSILSLGAVDFNDPTNQFYEECRVWAGAEIDQAAIDYCGFTRTQASDPTKQSDGELLEKFFAWAKQCSEITIAGENVVWLDLAIISATAHRTGIDHQFAFKSQFSYQGPMPFGYRTVDLHSLSYAHHLSRGIRPRLQKGLSKLSLDETLVYVGLEPEPKPHHGLNGAKLEAEAFSRLIYGRILLDEYAHLVIPEYLAQPRA